MKRIPRNISGKELIAALKIFEYEITRQVGSHIRITTLQNGEHHITIPNDDPLRIETLSSILNEVAIHFQLSKEEVIDRIF